MAGSVIEVSVKPGQPVHAGQQLAVMSAMKMETAVCAPCAGVVTQVRVRWGCGWGLCLPFGTLASCLFEQIRRGSVSVSVVGWGGLSIGCWLCWFRMLVGLVGWAFAPPTISALSPLDTPQAAPPPPPSGCNRPRRQPGGGRHDRLRRSQRPKRPWGGRGAPPRDHRLWPTRHHGLGGCGGCREGGVERQWEREERQWERREAGGGRGLRMGRRLEGGLGGRGSGSFLVWFFLLMRLDNPWCDFMSWGVDLGLPNCCRLAVCCCCCAVLHTPGVGCAAIPIPLLLAGVTVCVRPLSLSSHFAKNQKKASRSLSLQTAALQIVLHLQRLLRIYVSTHVHTLSHRSEPGCSPGARTVQTTARLSGQLHRMECRRPLLPSSTYPCKVRVYLCVFVCVSVFTSPVAVSSVDL